MIYKVSVVEVYRTVVTVEADSEQAAHQRVSDAWANTEFCLGPEDSDGVEFHILGEADGTEVTSVDRKGVAL